MKVYLKRRNINLSALTVHRYMNKEMGLKSIVRRRKPGYTKGHPYKLFRNILEQDFTCDESIQNGVQILPICIYQMEARDITVQL